jgi:hypothetical protein
LPDKIQRLTPLIGGILRQQRNDGSYKILFDAVPDIGEELISRADVADFLVRQIDDPALIAATPVLIG